MVRRRLDGKFAAWIVVLGVVALTARYVGVFAQAPAYDLLIRNARIVDGTGNPWYRSEIVSSTSSAVPGLDELMNEMVQPAQS